MGVIFKIYKFCLYRLKNIFKKIFFSYICLLLLTNFTLAVPLYSFGYPFAIAAVQFVNSETFFLSPTNKRCEKTYRFFTPFICFLLLFSLKKRCCKISFCSIGKNGYNAFSFAKLFGKAFCRCNVCPA